MTRSTAMRTSTLRARQTAAVGVRWATEARGAAEVDMEEILSQMIGLIASISIKLVGKWSAPGLDSRLLCHVGSHHGRH